MRFQGLRRHIVEVCTNRVNHTLLKLQEALMLFFQVRKNLGWTYKLIFLVQMAVSVSHLSRDRAASLLLLVCRFLHFYLLGKLFIEFSQILTDFFILKVQKPYLFFFTLSCLSHRWNMVIFWCWIMKFYRRGKIRSWDCLGREIFNKAWNFYIL